MSRGSSVPFAETPRWGVSTDACVLPPPNRQRGMGTAPTGDCAGGAVSKMGSFRKKSLGGRVLFAKDGGTAEPDDG